MNEKVVADNQEPDHKDTGEDTSAQTDDLDSLLASIDAEFDDKTPAKEPDRLAQLESQIKSIQNLSVEQSVQSAVSTIRENLDVKVPDIAIKGWLNEEANQDPRIQKAFQESNTNPVAWNKILKSIAGKMSKEFGSQPDPELNAGREAVATAMRGKSTVTVDDEAPNYDQMNDQEFQAWKQKFG